MEDVPLHDGRPQPPQGGDKQRVRRRRRVVKVRKHPWRRRLISFGTSVAIIGGVLWLLVPFLNNRLRSSNQAYVPTDLTFGSPEYYRRLITDYDRRIAADPRDWQAFYERAAAHEELDEIDEALADYQAAAALKPDLADVHTAVATIYRNLGDPEAAIAALTRSIEIAPSVTGHYERGATYAEMGEHEKAIEDFTWGIEEMGNAPWLYFARAASRRAIGDEAGAREDERKAASFDRTRDITGEPGSK